MPTHRLLGPERRLAGDAPQASGKPRAGSRRDGAERRSDPRNGDREVPAALRRRVEGAPEHVGHPGGNPGGAEAGRRARHRRRDHAEFPPADPDDHPVGDELLYRDAHRSGRRAAFGDDFWGFWMLGGMSGGGMGFIFAPDRKADAQARLQEIMSATKRELQNALPFAMEPVVYDFAINERGTWADLLEGATGLMPGGYYTLTVPALLAAGTPRVAGAPPGRTGQVRRGLPQSTRAARHGADAVRGHAAAGQDRRRRRQILAATAGRTGFRPRPARANPRRLAGRADWPRAKPSPGRHHDRGRARRRCRRQFHGRTGIVRVPGGGTGGITTGRGGGVHPGRGRRFTLDPRRRRGEGAAPVLQTRRGATALSSRRTSPRAAASAAKPGPGCRTSSRPVT